MFSFTASGCKSCHVLASPTSSHIHPLLWESLRASGQSWGCAKNASAWPELTVKAEMHWFVGVPRKIPQKKVFHFFFITAPFSKSPRNKSSHPQRGWRRKKRREISKGENRKWGRETQGKLPIFLLHPYFPVRCPCPLYMWPCPKRVDLTSKWTPCVFFSGSG